MRAVYKNTVLAESDNTEVVEGNHYFPREDVDMDCLTESDKAYTCPWKGEATYYHIIVGDQRIENGAWSYEEPKERSSPKSCVKVYSSYFYQYVFYCARLHLALLDIKV